MAHQACRLAQDGREQYTRNHQALVDVFRHGEHPGPRGAGGRALGLELERFVYDRSTGRTVGYGGDGGVERLLEGMARFYDEDGAVFVDGRLAGYSGEVVVNGEVVGITVSLEPAAQLEASVGPSASVRSLLGAVEAFDRQVHVACREMGADYELLPRGLNPTVSAPEDLPLIPKRRYELMDAYLSKTGRYARDMMRCTASTQVSIDYGSEADAVAEYRLAACLGPVVSFACDNVAGWRGSDPADTPAMVRSRIWEEVDPARCGLVPGTFDDGFGFEAYLLWLEGICPILFTDADGRTTPTDGRTEGEIMAERPLAPSELAHMLSMAFPDVRWKGFCEIRPADSMPPRLAAGLVAFFKGLYYDDASFGGACSLFRGATEGDVAVAWSSLRCEGWDAEVYGRNAGELVDSLVTLARAGLHDPDERGLLDGLAKLWAARMVPRDLLLRNLSK